MVLWGVRQMKRMGHILSGVDTVVLVYVAGQGTAGIAVNCCVHPGPRH